MGALKKVLLPLTDPAHAAPYLKLGTALLSPEGKILALGVVRVPEESSLSEGAEEAPDYRALLEELAAKFSDERVELKTLVRVSHRLSEGISETAREEGCDLVLLPWKGYTASEDRLFGSTIDRILEQPPCAIMVARADDLSSCRSILLPVRGGPYAEYALEIVEWLAGAFGAEVTVLHCQPVASGVPFDDRGYRSFLRKLRLYPQVRRMLTVHGNPHDAIIEEATEHDLVVVGAGGTTEPAGSFLGPLVDRVAREMRKPLLVVKTRQPYLSGGAAQVPVRKGRQMVCREHVSSRGI
ncbi:MAG: universal stress protein [Deltaproteobacteria bacterium]|nr:universal stress protein [Deltaproteobacteria bacterium]